MSKTERYVWGAGPVHTKTVYSRSMLYACTKTCFRVSSNVRKAIFVRMKSTKIVFRTTQAEGVLMIVGMSWRKTFVRVDRPDEFRLS